MCITASWARIAARRAAGPAPIWRSRPKTSACWTVRSLSTSTAARCRPVKRASISIYNTLAAYALSKASEIVSFEGFQRAIEAYRPTNGRLQTFHPGTRSVMTNLAKNPTGFNQNIRIVLNEGGRVLALFVNDEEADGCDVSWFWDIDFERWSQIEGLKAFVGGSRANDMQVRLKYAGIDSTIVETAADVLAATEESDGKVYVIANYTALPPLRRELETLEKASADGSARKEGE